MNIIIVGCGKVGQTLARQLSLEGNNITVIDSVAENVRAVTDKIDAMGVIGNGATHTVQRDAGIKKADLLIAVTGADELNILASIVAKRESECRTIARVRSHEYYTESPYLKEELGLAMVLNPELAAAEEIARVLRFPSAISIEPFAKGRVELVKFRLPKGCPIAGMTVREFVGNHRCDVLFCTVERGDEAHIVKGDFIFLENDVISIIAEPKQALEFSKLIGYKTRAVKDAIIVGGGEVTHYLCRALRRTGISLRVIERDKARAERLASEHDKITVVNADTADEEILAEEGIEEAGAFIALTDNDEENLILSLFAKQKSRGKLVTKINRIDYDDVIQRLSLDTVIYPKNIIADMIVRYARSVEGSRGGNIETLYSVIKGKIEAVEFIVRRDSEVAGVPLSMLKLRKGVLVAAIMRGRDLIIPRGHDIIEVGDAVIVVSEITGIRDIADILE